MKLLIWDFDGTLAYRSGGAWTASVWEVIHREVPEVEVAPEDIAPYMRSGFPWHSPEEAHAHLDSADAWWAALAPVFERAYIGVGLDMKLARTLSQRVRAVYLDPTRWQQCEDAPETLAALAADGWRQVILSNHVPELPDLVDHLGLDAYFERIYNSVEIGYEKPNVRAFAPVLQDYAQAAPVWMIGDSYHADVLGAAAAGLPAVLVHRYHPEASHYVASLRDIPELVRCGV